MKPSTKIIRLVTGETLIGYTNPFPKGDKDLRVMRPFQMVHVQDVTGMPFYMMVDYNLFGSSEYLDVHWEQVVHVTDASKQAIEMYEFYQDYSNRVSGKNMVNNSLMIMERIREASSRREEMVEEGNEFFGPGAEEVEPTLH